MISMTDPLSQDTSLTGQPMTLPCSTAIGCRLPAVRLLDVTSGIFSPDGIIAPINCH
jgi:hypothetical protein